MKSLAPILWLSILALVLNPFLIDQPWGRVASSFLIGGTALLALRRSGVQRRVQIAANSAVLLAIVAGFGAREIGNAAWLQTVAAGFYSALLMVTPLVVVYRLVLRPKITLDTVAGALAAYIQIGIFFAAFYQFIALWSGDPFFAQANTGTPMDYQFFSFVTLTTLGYGDLTPAQASGQSFAVIEAIMGQVFLVTVVAMAVGNLGKSLPERSSAE